MAIDKYCIDFSAYDEEDLITFLDHSSLVERIFHGAIWENPWFRRVAGQTPYSIERRTIDHLDQVLAYHEPQIVWYNETQYYVPPAVSEYEPWKKDYSQTLFKLRLTNARLQIINEMNQ
ncbi:MAG: hypothetical protein ACQESG_07165 [Nanobdellota archaeon]